MESDRSEKKMNNGVEGRGCSCGDKSGIKQQMGEESRVNMNRLEKIRKVERTEEGGREGAD